MYDTAPPLIPIRCVGCPSRTGMVKRGLEAASGVAMGLRDNGSNDPHMEPTLLSSGRSDSILYQGYTDCAGIDHIWVYDDAIGIVRACDVPKL